VITIRLALLVFGTIVIVDVSRAPLRRPISHGFYRFLAWEAILGLAALNLHRWIRDPLSWHQLISWPLLVIAALLVIAGVHLLKGRGEPDEARDDVPLIAFEKTTTLVTTGLYRYIRHPLYSSLLFLAWGIFFKAPSWAGGLLGIIATAALTATARVEEGENLRYFGDQYREYMKQTAMFIPYIF
jgi:protein-S-isoprenylcysteine O-methyltransferase Ste14